VPVQSGVIFYFQQLLGTREKVASQHFSSFAQLLPHFARARLGHKVLWPISHAYCFGFPFRSIYLCELFPAVSPYFLAKAN